jgi:hypothetical protein
MTYVELVKEFKSFRTPSTAPDICRHCGGVLELSDSVIRITTDRKQHQWCYRCWRLIGRRFTAILRRATYPSF